MGSAKSKEELRYAADGGRINTQIIEERWFRYSHDGVLPKVSAMAFLGSIAQDLAIEMSESDLQAIVDSCTNNKGLFGYTDMLILFKRFAKEQRIALTSTLDECIQQASEREKSNRGKFKTPPYNPLLDNHAVPSRAEDISNYIAALQRSRHVISYLCLLPRDVLNCALKHLEASEIMHAPFGLSKIWEEANNIFCTDSFQVRGNALLCHTSDYRDRRLKAKAIDTGEVLWESVKMTHKFQTGAVEDVMCVNSAGHVFYFSLGAKLLIFEPPNCNWSQSIALAPSLAVCAVQDRVYALCRDSSNSGTLYCIERPQIPEGKAEDDREYTARKIASLAIVAELYGHLHVGLSVMNSHTHGDVAVVTQVTEMALVFLDSGRVEHVRLVEPLSQNARLRLFYPVVCGSRLMYVHTHEVRVHSLDDLSAPLFKYVLAPNGSHAPCQLRLLSDGSVCALHTGEKTLLLLNAQGEKQAQLTIPSAKLPLTSSATCAWHLSGQTLLLATSDGHVHWIDLTTGKVRISEQLHDSDFRLGIQIYGDYLLSGGQYRIKCWKPRT